MQYALLMYGDEAHGETPTAMPPELAVQWDAFWSAQGDGAPVLGWSALAPTTTASTLRIRAGKAGKAGKAGEAGEADGTGEPVVTDGPFAETKEQLGGLIVIECADLDAALAFATTVPCAPRGSIEVRAIAESG